MKKAIWGGVALVVLLMATPSFAQEKQAAENPTPVSAAAPSASVADAPAALTAQDQQVFGTLQMRAIGLAQAIAVLQEKLDSVNAEYARQVDRVLKEHPGYELSPQGTLVKKQEKGKQ